MNFAQKKYNQYYKSMGFERKGLFKLIQKEFNPKAVLYPGCSIHLTPSFYFNHVVYVDKGDLAKEFFGHGSQVSQLIIEAKEYAASAYWQFIAADFQAELGLRKDHFDLLLSVFSGRMIGFCEKYLKIGGLVLTTSLFSDNESMDENENFQLIAMVHCTNGKYKIDHSLSPRKTKESTLRRKDKGFEYVDNETYYIYKKMMHAPH